MVAQTQIYIIFISDSDVNLYLFNQDQYLNYLTKKLENRSIDNIACLYSVIDDNYEEKSLSYSKVASPLYIVIDPRGRDVEVTFSYRYTIYDKDINLIIFGFMLFLLIISIYMLYINQRINPWNEFHYKIYELAYKKFHQKNYSDSILTIFREFESWFKKIVFRKRSRNRHSSGLIDFILDPSNPKVILNPPNITQCHAGDIYKYRKNCKDFILSSYRLFRNILAHENLEINRLNAFRIIYILDDIFKKLENAKIECEHNIICDFYDYITNNNCIH